MNLRTILMEFRATVATCHSPKRIPEPFFKTVVSKSSKGDINMPRVAHHRSTICFRLLTLQLLVCCLAASVAAERPEPGNGILAGEVADAIEGAPISRAFVLVHSSGRARDTVARLEPSGRFQVPLTPGRYDIFVAADGFVPTCKVVEIVTDQITQFSARLRADVEHAEQSSHQ